VRRNKVRPRCNRASLPGVGPDVFVVGYGMDVAHAFRQLPFVGLVDYGDGEPDLFDTGSDGTAIA
jgi:hypoxanthine phosphoribosyltransferase